MARPCFKLERDHPMPLAGVDEAGCAPLAGPVVAAAVVLDRDKFPRGIDDSKKLDLEAREAIYARLQKQARCGVGICSVEEIDTLNIYWARMLAMVRAVDALGFEPAMVMVDGNRCPKWNRPSVTRDRMMVTYAEAHPGYGWEHNRGYPTPDHRRALRDLGPTPLHRRSFGLVREMLATAAQPELGLHEMAAASPLSHTTTA
jgi:ribonuclease HII